MKFKKMVKTLLELDDPRWKALDEIWGMTDLIPSAWPDDCLEAYQKSIEGK